jgi:hypothetical protein
VQLHDNRLAHRIDGRIGDLGKALAEEGIDRPRRMRQGRQGVSSPMDHTASLPSLAMGASTMRTSSRV